MNNRGKDKFPVQLLALTIEGTVAQYGRARDSVMWEATCLFHIKRYHPSQANVHLVITEKRTRCFFVFRSRENYKQTLTCPGCRDLERKVLFVLNLEMFCHT